MSRWLKEKTAVLEAAIEMERRGLVVGTAGNVSLRLPRWQNREILAITPSSRYYDTLEPEDIQIIDFNARPVSGDLPPSTEAFLHINIYRARNNINAILHTHSVYASAAAVAGLYIPPILDDQVVFLGGEIKLAGPGESVTEVLAALEDRNAALLPNHGAVGLGRDMRAAITAAELIEKTAKIYLLALGAGKINLISDTALEEKRALFNYLQNPEI